uniref:SCP domain-containing protein n=1 Tax=Panagrolaimus sp. ES5 TaxID=591445 RepID=A0AC34F9D8_9BILA
MFCVYQIIVVVACVASIVLGQSTTCSNNNLLMTPILRQKVLNVLNEARSKLESGQLLMIDGKYAVQAASLPPLTWSCEIEEKIFEWMEESCPTFTSQPLNLTWTYTKTDDSNAEALVDSMLESLPGLSGRYHSQLSRHNLLLLTPPVYAIDHIIALSDKAHHVACVIHKCHFNATDFNGNQQQQIQNNIFCKVSLTEDLKFGDEIYQVSPSANYTPPSKDVVCSPINGITIEQREAFLEKINAARNQISQGIYQLENGNTALTPAQPLSPLVKLLQHFVNTNKHLKLFKLWSCEDENAMAVELSSCPVSIEASTEFQKTVTGSFDDFTAANLLTWWSDLANEYFIQNPNLNFLSQTSNYSTQYPAAFALSSQAESIACNTKFCFGSTLSYSFVCRGKPFLQINDIKFKILCCISLKMCYLF